MIPLAKRLIFSLCATALVPSACASSPSAAPPSPDASAGNDAQIDGSALRHFEADAWADNWFALYLGDTLLKEDSVPITTERSFNAESFAFDARYPLTLAFVLKDFMQNESGLEYIGLPNQQIGDGGFIFQLRDTLLGRTVLVSSAAWRCLPIQRAPLNASCEKDPNPLQTCKWSSVPEPAGWHASTFDDSTWPQATVFTAAAVGPKDGYNTIKWDAGAQFIWSSDLKIDNIVLCRVTLTAP